jgi:transposase-like protein
MSRKCTVCGHPNKDEIDKALVSKGAIRDIARQFDIDKSALSRHKQNHLPSILARAEDAKEVTKANNLIDEIERLRVKAERIARKAEKKGDYRTALAGIRELTRIVEILAKMQGELKEHTTNIVLNAKWIELRAIILSALEDFPEARTKLSEVLRNAC